MKRDVHAVSADGYDLSRAIMHKSRDEKELLFCMSELHSVS